MDSPIYRRGIDLHKAKKLLADFEYKGYEFSIYQDLMNYPYYDGNQAKFKIQGDLPDANDPLSRLIPIVFVTLFPLLICESKKDFFKYVFFCIQKFESHEIIEAMKFKGHHIFDPHPQGGGVYGPSHYLGDSVTVSSA